MLRSELAYDQRLLLVNQRMAYQGVLKNCQRKYFGNVAVYIVRRTFKHTTQLDVLPPSSHLQQQFKSSNPALNLCRRNAADTTDQTFSDTPAMNGGETIAHILVGKDSKITNVYKAKDNSGAEFLGTLQDQVCSRRVPTKLIADNLPIYRGWNITKHLRDLTISMWQYEMKYQNQNPAENRYQTIKRHTNRTMERSGAPAAAWFLCLVYICLCLNNYVDPKLGDGTKSPIMMACFAHNDISTLLNFYLWQPVYYLLDPTDQSFPGKSKEIRTRWDGVDGSIGAKMCYKLVDDNSRKIICRSVIRSATKLGSENLQVDPIKPLSKDAIIDTEEDAILDGFMSFADF